MLECTPNMWKRPPNEPFEAQKRRVLRLSSMWKDYDWTAQLREAAVS